MGAWHRRDSLPSNAVLSRLAFFAKLSRFASMLNVLGGFELLTGWVCCCCRFAVFLKFALPLGLRPLLLGLCTKAAGACGLCCAPSALLTGGLLVGPSLAVPAVKS